EPQPDLARTAHGLLMGTYRRSVYFELHVHHRREFVRLSRELGALPGVSAKEFNAALDRQEKELAELDKQLKTRRDSFDVNTRRIKSVVQKAQIALRFGLIEKAVSLLSEARPEDLVDPRSRVTVGGQMLVDLFLATGRLKEAGDVLTPELQEGKKFDKRSFG